MNSMALALEIGLKGMGGVFAVLSILAVCVWGLAKMDSKAK